jgi:hypothetical protein
LFSSDSLLELVLVLVLVLALVSVPVLDVSLVVELEEPQPAIDNVSEATTSPVNNLLFFIFYPPNENIKNYRQ